MIACTALVLVAACADAPTGPEGGGPPPDGLTITVGQVAEPLSLDPHAVIDQPSARAIRQVYDTLVDQTDTLELVPGLAERWTQVDDVTWEFEIRPGVSFHDGSLLTGSDVVFTLERLRDPTTFAPVSFLLASVDEIELVDAMTVRITTVQPFVPLLTNLAQTATSILSESALTAAGDAYGTTVVVGTGPFRFASWEAGSEIVLERNDTWWGGDVGPERLVMRSIPDAGLRAAEIEDGAIDVAYALATSDAVRFRDDTAITLAEIETLNTAYIGFNAQKAPFDDVRVRQAINHAIDVDVIIDEVYQGAGVRASSPIGPQVFGAHPDLEPYAHDKVLALDLLAEAGLADGFSATLWTNLNPIRIQIADIVADQLAEVGIDIEVQVLEWSTYLNDTAAGEHDMFILAWTTANADADYGLYSLFHSSAFGHAGNRSFWSNARVDELLDLGRTTADPDARRDHYHEAQEIIADEAPWIFLNTTIESNATRADVTGFVPHPTGHHRLFGLDKE
ncbi:MAG: glutathione ABC transporter substrate-binding protein [Trueperaceae bacterium]|nr:MAG: glutathione ABC transporter substrate-binding protein [Trueperaceae bacterium]